MVKKLKVVDVAEDEEAKPIEQPTPVEPTAVEVEDPIQEDVKPIEEEVVEEAQVIDAPQVALTKQPKQCEYITCENCNKNMLMNTFRYSHKKVCDAKNKPPPPPPPSPEPKTRPKRIAKPKEIKQAEVVEPEIPKQAFDGVVSFDPFLAMREQRQMVRTQRVKSLISQAI